MAVPDLRPNSQDTSAFYLGNIYQILADPNTTISPTSIISPVAQPPPFSPPRYAVWVNSLWFMSLVISLTCALLATSLQQWARRYTRVTQPARCSPEKRARMRAFFSRGVDNMDLPLVVEGLPTLIHLAVFLFFAGLIIFLLNVNASTTASRYPSFHGSGSSRFCMHLSPSCRYFGLTAHIIHRSLPKYPSFPAPL
jgi:hypothetical protein